ncbi:MAG: hypothetical protein L6309_02650 [Candidatus Omnitrophica bacterium]|nr:hypothetical protein [Candidatus Omnitrophota bacterium]
MPNIFAQAMMDTISYVPRTLLVMFISLFVSGVLMELGVFKKLEFLGRPLVRLARLPTESAITFITSAGSVIAGNTMLAKLYQEKRIGRREVFLSALLNGIPVYVKETFTYQIPIIIPILGFKVGGIYFLSFLASGIIKIIFVIVYGQLTAKRLKPCGAAIDFFPAEDKPFARTHKDIISVVLKREMKVFFRVSMTFISMTFIVFVLVNNGALGKLKEIVQPMTDFFKLPVSAAIPVSTYMLSPLVGATSIGTMLKEGILSDFQAIVACMLGGFLMLPVFSIRYSLAKYTAIFGLSLGTNIVVVSTVLGMIVRAIFLVVFLFMI